MADNKKGVNYSELLTQELYLNADFFSFGDSESAQDVLKGLLRKEQFLGLTLRGRYDVLTDVAINFQESEPFIALELAKYAQSIGNLLNTQKNKETEGVKEAASITVAGTTVRLHGDSYWSANTKSLKKSPMELEIEKIKREYERNNPRHTVIHHMVQKIVAKPYVSNPLVCLASNTGLTYIYDIKEHQTDVYKSIVKNPSFFTNKEHSIPGFEYWPFELKSQILFLYGSTEENQPSAIEFKYPYCVRGYDKGLLEVTVLDLEDDASNEKRNFSLKDFADSITNLLIDDHKLYVAFAVSDIKQPMIAMWDLKSKKRLKIIPSMLPVKSMMVQNGILTYLIENILMGLDGDQEFEIPIDVKNVETMVIRNDGFVMGKNDGIITFFKIDNQLHAPKEMDIRITEPITAVHCFDDIIIAQSEKGCSIIKYPLTD